MTDKKIMDLKNKVTDLKRFSFILLALCGFLSVGLVLPTDAIVEGQEGLLVGLTVILLVAAFYFHRSAMKAQQLINEEE